jgi:carbon monoxide dehydrogenase subunit G
MQVDLQKIFPVQAPASSSWQVLSDIETVASCMPGAEVTSKVDDNNYTGKVKSKIGPATMAFDGTIEILGIDEANRELRMTSKGQDSKGSSSAQMDLVARVVDAEGGNSELHGEAKVIVNGKVASLGGRMMTQVADQILSQFGDNFAARAQSLAEGAATGEVLAAPEPKAINGLAFIWSVLVGFIKSLFGGKSGRS